MPIHPSILKNKQTNIKRTKKANKIILGHAFSSKENTTASKLFVMEKNSQIPAEFPSTGSLVWRQGKDFCNTENEQKRTKNLDKVRQTMPRKVQRSTSALAESRSELVDGTPAGKGGQPWRSTD